MPIYHTPMGDVTSPDYVLPNGRKASSYPSDPDVSSGDVGSVKAQNVPVQSPSVGTQIHVTNYGYEKPGEADYDSYSARGIGDRNNQLTPGYSVALSKAERLARFGTSGGSTGKEFVFNGKTYRDDDTSPQAFRNIDIYDPYRSGTGQPDRVAATGSGTTTDPGTQSRIAELNTAIGLSKGTGTGTDLISQTLAPISKRTDLGSRVASLVGDIYQGGLKQGWWAPRAKPVNPVSSG